MTDEKSTLSDSTLPTTTEEWRDIPGYEGLYQVSDQGRVRRPLGVKRAGRVPSDGILRPGGNNVGYKMVVLHVNKTARPALVHRLIMLAFVGECPPGKVVNHKNGIRDDNRLENLEYVTYRENVLHGFTVSGWGVSKVGLGETNCQAKLTKEKVRRIRQLIRDGWSNREIAKLFDVTQPAIYAIKIGKSWKHLKD